MSSSDPPTAKKYVSRAGRKLEHALREFRFDVTGRTCADFGCNVGGFTDCLLRHGAAQVYAIDTGYGVLAYPLRTDPRVVVMERANVLHAAPQAAVDLVTIDVAWTAQRHVVPAALRWMQRGAGRIITLIKPHYELDDSEKRELLHGGALDPSDAERVMQRVLDAMPALGARPLAHVRSPVTGSKSARRASRRAHDSAAEDGIGPGNVEFLALLEPLIVA